MGVGNGITAYAKASLLTNESASSFGHEYLRHSRPSSVGVMADLPIVLQPLGEGNLTTLHELVQWLANTTEAGPAAQYAKRDFTGQVLSAGPLRNASA